MRKLFLALMAVVAIVMTVCIGCEKTPINEPEAPENDRNHNVFLDDTNEVNQTSKVPLRLVQDNQ